MARKENTVPAVVAVSASPALPTADAEASDVVAEVAPATRPRAVGSIRCFCDGRPITIEDDAEIPTGVDLATLPPHCIKEG